MIPTYLIAARVRRAAPNLPFGAARRSGGMIANTMQKKRSAVNGSSYRLKCLITLNRGQIGVRPVPSLLRRG